MALSVISGHPRRRWLRPALLLSVLLLSACSVGWAQPVIYQQPPVYVPPNGNVGLSFTSIYNAAAGGFLVYDNFIPTTTAPIGAVRWFGFYWDYAVPANNPVGPSTTSWTITFYADNAGAPGASLGSASLPAASVTTTQIGTALFGRDTVNVYRMDVPLPAPVPVTAGTKYWISIQSVQTAGPSPLFSWIEGTGGDAVSLQQAILPGGAPAGPPATVTGDRAFTLFAQIQDAFQIKYFNINYGSGNIIVSNAGSMSSGNNPADDSSGTICANVYSFDPNEEMQTCCACPVTPNGLSSLNVNEDIIAQNLIVNPSTAITVKVLFTLKSGQNGGGICDPTQPTSANLASGGLAWGTNLRNVTFQGSPPSTVNAVTETRFTRAELSSAELSKLATYCRYIKILGSSVAGICKSCQAGARGAIGR